MAKDLRTFTKGKMNKELDERLVPDGEYTDALNIRVGSTEEDEMGVIETTLGNTQLTTLQVQNTPLSSEAQCIGTLEDGSNETIYWFVHDPNFSASGNTNKLDLIVSFNTQTQVTRYHVISMDDGGGIDTTLNFNPTYLITGVSLIDNLLFFTDDYNPPRRINVERTYGEPTSGDVDTITADELLVIKRAPVTSPLVNSSFNENISSTFMEERFICFAYRWRYDDNEYSATSQFSTPVFTPKAFDFTPKSYLNEGFINKHNNATITYNTGSSLVKGIDILFKEANDSTIKVIEKLDKEELGLPDNNDLTFNFSDSKIFTILPNSEILRLYDNVPLLAQAQTLMGNRLMYGNYLEGYDLIDSDGNATRLNYISTLRQSDITEEALPTGNVSTASYTYTLPQSVTGGTSETVTAAKQTIDLTPFCVDGQGNSRLTAGSVMEFEFQIYLASNTQEVGTGSFPSQVPSGTLSDPQTITVTFTLNANYETLADWMNSAPFQNQVGTLTNILPVYDSGGASTSCDGGTLTDSYNCGRDSQLGTFTLVTTGITSATTIAQPEPIIFTQTSGNECEVVFTGLRYTNNPASPTLDSFFFYRFEAAATTVTFFPAGTAESLHSNRGYEIGMIYMDEYNRSTTALVSNNNAVHVPCSASDTKNQIRVEIPTSQKPPSWATRYKFGIKPDESGYNTIYSNTFFVDSTQNRAYILLQGENPRKVEEGDRLIVKADTSGAVNECLYVTVLEKKVMQADDLPGSNGLTGTYMVISTDGLALTPSAGTFKDTGLVQAVAGDFVNAGNDRKPYIFLPLNEPMGNPPNGSIGPGVDYDVPSGSIVTIKLQSDRIGGTNRCDERRLNIDDVQFTVTQNYSSLAAFFEGDGVINTLINESYFTGEGNVGVVQNGGSASPTIVTDPSVEEGSGILGGGGQYDTGNGKDDMRTGSGGIGNANDMSDLGVPTGTSQNEFGACILTYPSNRKYLGFAGTLCCGSNPNKRSTLKGRITVRRAIDLLVFETLPADAQPDIFFESSVSYPITNGFHEGNVQNQTSTQSAIVDTAFYNCYTYGNGVESYKIRDSIVGKDFTLGNRVTATQGQDYKQVRRYADITYSGVYNQESNINKTNEFNLGLLNFKPLEQRFGYIRKMAGRETDILVLQEDKISYVLAGKNLLSDAVGGGDITSIPEVLGTQIARTEEYGISSNPESYAEYGYDKFFTDAKRGVVIQLRGSSAQNEQLNVISDQGMSTWFRELFQVSFDRQKLGAYDPYAGEYVLSSNLRNLPSEKKELPCGTAQTFIVEGGVTASAIYNLGTITGNVVITYQFVGTGNFNDLRFTYDGVVYNTGPQSSPTIGTLTVPKPNPSPTTGLLTVGGGGSKGTVLIMIKCPDGQPLSVIQVCLTSGSDAGELIHNEFSFAQGTYTSPTSSTQVTFSNSGIAPVVSQYDIFSGIQGSGFIPTEGSTVTMAGNRFGSDTFVTQAGTQFSFLRSSVSYPNTPTGITNLLAAIASPPVGLGGSVAISGIGSTYTVGSFVNGPSATSLPNLYLVYDYRASGSAVSLCYDGSKPELACCCGTTVSVYLDAADLASATAIYTDAAFTTPAATGYYSDANAGGLGIYRYQTTSGSTATLSPPSTCSACLTSCGTDVRGTNNKEGYYDATVDVGTTTGAMIIQIGSASVPFAVRAVYDGGVTNKISSNNYGKLQSGNASGYTLVGESASLCSNAIGTNILDNYISSGGNWVSASGNTTITLNAADNETTATNTGAMVMVINKPNPTPSTISIQFAAVCDNVPTIATNVVCPQTLTSSAISNTQVSHVAACAVGATGRVAYFVHTDGTTGGAPQLYSFSFASDVAAVMTPDGFYWYDDGSANGLSFEVTDGIITAIQSCP